MLRSVLNKWNSLSVEARSSCAFVFSSFIIKGISFVTTPIYTRLMDATQFGVVAVYNSWTSILEIFALLGLTSAGVFNVGMNDYKTCRNQYISSILGMCNTATVIVFGVLLSTTIFLGSDFILPANLLLIMFVTFIFNPALIFWISRQRYEYKYKAATVVTIVSAVVSQIVTVVCVKYVKNVPSGTVKIWSNQLSLLLFEIPIFFMLLRQGKKYVDIKLWRSVLIFAMPLLPHYLAQHVMLSADRIMLAKMYSESSAGIYAVVSYISLIATIVWTAINVSFVPYTFNKLNQKEYDGIANVANKVVSCYAYVCVCISLFAPEILRILAPPAYYDGMYVVPAIICVAYLSALYNLYANIEFYYKKSFYIASATIVAAIVNFVLNYIFIPRFGFVAAAHTTLASYIILVAMHFYGYKKCDNDVCVYDNRRICAYTISALLISELSQILYGNCYVRYMIITVIVMLVVYKYRKVIIGIRKHNNTGRFID